MTGYSCKGEAPLGIDTAVQARDFRDRKFPPTEEALSLAPFRYATLQYCRKVAGSIPDGVIGIFR
jgi:hypothetical protein